MNYLFVCGTAVQLQFTVITVYSIFLVAANLIFFLCEGINFTLDQ